MKLAITYKTLFWAKILLPVHALIFALIDWMSASRIFSSNSCTAVRGTTEEMPGDCPSIEIFYVIMGMFLFAKIILVISPYFIRIKLGLKLIIIMTLLLNIAYYLNDIIRLFITLGQNLLRDSISFEYQSVGLLLLLTILYYIAVLIIALAIQNSKGTSL